MSICSRGGKTNKASVISSIKIGLMWFATKPILYFPIKVPILWRYYFFYNYRFSRCISRLGPEHPGGHSDWSYSGAISCLYKWEMGLVLAAERKSFHLIRRLVVLLQKGGKKTICSTAGSFCSPKTQQRLIDEMASACDNGRKAHTTDSVNTKKNTCSTFPWCIRLWASLLNCKKNK